MRRFILRRVWVTALAGLLILLGGYTAYRVMLSPELVRRKAVLSLSAMLGVPVEVGEATFHPLSGLNIKEIVVPVEHQGRRQVLARMTNLRATHYLGSLFTGRLNMREISAESLQLYVERSADGTYNLDPVLAALRAKPPTPTILPVINVNRVELTYLDQKVLDKQGRGLNVNLDLLQARVVPRPGERLLDLTVMVDDPQFGKWRINEGTLNVDTGELSVAGESGPLEMTEALGLRLGAKGYEAWKAFGPPHGGSASLVVYLTYQAHRREPLWFRAEADVKGMAAAFDQFPYEVEDVHGHLVFSKQGVSIPRLVGRSGPATFLLTGTIEGYEELSGVDVHVDATNCDIDEKLRQAFRPKDREVYDAFVPSGRVDGTIHITRQRGQEHVGVFIDALNSPRSSEDPTPIPIRVTFKPFPYTLDLVGRGRYNDGVVVLDRDRPMMASHGSALFRVSGTVIADEPNPRIDLDFQGVDLALDQDLYRALADENKPIWDFLQPDGGTVSVGLHLSRTNPKIAEVDHVVTVSDIRSRFTAKAFPCTVEAVGGTMVYETSHDRWPRGRLLVQDFKGRHGEAEVAVSGEFSGFGGKGVVDNMKLSVTGRNVRLDENLHKAVPENVTQIWDFLNPDPQSVVNTECTFERTETRSDDLDYRVRVDAADVSLKCTAFPYPVNHLSGTAEFRRDHRDSPDGELVLSNLHTNQGKAEVEIAGRLLGFQSDQPPKVLHLTVRGKNIPLDSTLRAALAPPYQKTYDALRPSGQVDILCNLDRDAAVAPDVISRVLITAQGTDVCYEAFPVPLEGLTGRVEVAGDQIRFSNLSGRVAGGEFSLSGVVSRPGDRPVYDLTLQATDLPLDAKALQMLPEEPRKLLEQLGPTGHADLAASVRRRWITQTEDEVLYNGWVRFKQTALAWGPKPSDINGTLSFKGIRNKESNNLAGRLDLATADIGKIELSDIVTSFEKKGSKLALHDLKATLYGGQVRGQVMMEMGSIKNYAAVLEVSDIELAQVATRLLRMNPDQVRGKLSGNVEFQGNGQTAADLVGRANLKVDHGKLWELPVILAVLNVLNIPPMDRTAFTDATAEVELYDERVHVKKLDLMGNTVSIYGEGTVTTGGDLDLSFLAGISRFAVPDVPLVGSLVKAVQKQLMMVRVGGSVRKPDLELEPIAPVTGTLKNIGTALFGRGPERR